MLSTADLTELVTDREDLGVSIFMSTHVSGGDTQQDPLRFKNLLGNARSQLSAHGIETADTDLLLEGAQALLEDRDFWLHRDLGLAVFAGEDTLRAHALPVPVAEQVVVGNGYHVTPLLPLLASGERFHVVTVTSREVAMFRASRFEISRVDHEAPPGPDGVQEESDYENPVQASPVARPHTGSTSISHAQVYGDSPEDWRKRRLVEYAHRVAAGIDRHVARDPAPVVLVASPTLSGHVQRA